VALELIKKLLLNRLLLNPSFFVLYNDPDEERIKQYVETANVIRVTACLFRLFSTPTRLKNSPTNSNAILS
jgi:hypothetical protein